MRREAQESPIGGRETGQVRYAYRGLVLGIERIVKRLFERRKLCNRPMLPVRLGLRQIVRKMGAKVLGIAIARWIGRRIAARHVLELVIAEIG